MYIETELIGDAHTVCRREGGGGDTRIEICCATSPGALISTMSALDVLGLEIEQCAVSCFGDFAIQASCSQEEGRRRVTITDEIKQALFKSAGYGGRLSCYDLDMSACVMH
ncbi:Transcription factor bHLH93 [Hordeum vulgare]|nr:Transcription factor bHLH93 [Hordeum vulgare]